MDLVLLNKNSFLTALPTRGLELSSLLASRQRGELAQAPGASEAWFEGDGVMIAAPMTVPFLIVADTKAEAVLKLTQLRPLAAGATSLWWPELPGYRALLGGGLSVAKLEPRLKDTPSYTEWEASITLRPRYGLWTDFQAEDYAAYQAARKVS